MTLRHIISAHQFLDRRLVNDVFKIADGFEEAERKGKTPKLLRSKILACVFYEPSTRTRFSFESAMLKLGGGVIATENAAHFSSARLYKKVKDLFVFDMPLLARLPKRAVIMHPLPRVNEIARAVDADPRAAYFRQAKNGLYVRMALLRMLLR